jgi:hypothetical protein
LLDRPLVPRDLWPQLELLITWRGGFCPHFEPYLEDCFGKVRIRAPIFAASEAVIAIPLADEMRGGVPALESTFFEFRPVGEESDRTLLVHELEPDGTYELIVSAPNGMYRYAIGDLVEVEGRVNACPTIVFRSRKGRTSSLTGEKLTELQVEDAVAQTARRLGFAPIHFLISAQLGAVPHYVLSLEWARPLPSRSAGEQFTEAVDELLGALNLEYRAKRASQRLAALTLHEVNPGEFDRLQALGLSSGNAANFKLPHLTSEAVHQRLAELLR